ncbi:hypothetical protein XELAEV_18002596mg [Xenopus laevis]|nr:hypothetical protein XELAEV_18002596mg [Xenopus laevis]
MVLPGCEWIHSGCCVFRLLGTYGCLWGASYLVGVRLPMFCTFTCDPSTLFKGADLSVSLNCCHGEELILCPAPIVLCNNIPKQLPLTLSHPANL